MVRANADSKKLAALNLSFNRIDNGAKHIKLGFNSALRENDLLTSHL
jgi:hypothetical protein